MEKKPVIVELVERACCYERIFCDLSLESRTDLVLRDLCG